MYRSDLDWGGGGSPFYKVGMIGWYVMEQASLVRVIESFYHICKYFLVFLVSYRLFQRK